MNLKNDFVNMKWNKRQSTGSDELAPGWQNHNHKAKVGHKSDC